MVTAILTPVCACLGSLGMALSAPSTVQLFPSLTRSLQVPAAAPANTYTTGTKPPSNATLTVR